MHDESPNRLSDSLETLNARIARLAIGLGVELSDPATLTRLMTMSPRPPVTVDRRMSAPDARVATSAERRASHLWEELRGLVTLRYHVETLSVAENGLAATREMMVQAHQHLMDQGFKAGADGVTAQVWQDLNALPTEKMKHE